MKFLLQELDRPPVIGINVPPRWFVLMDESTQQELVMTQSELENLHYAIERIL